MSSHLNLEDSNHHEDRKIKVNIFGGGDDHNSIRVELIALGGQTETTAATTIVTDKEEQKEEIKEKPTIKKEEIKSNSSNPTPSSSSSSSSSVNNNSNNKPKIEQSLKKPVKTPIFEELTIEEEEQIKRVEPAQATLSTLNNSTTSSEKEVADDQTVESEFSLINLPSKVLNFFEKMVISNKSRIEMMKSLGNLMYLGNKTRTDVDVDSEQTDNMTLLNDIYETEKISTAISVIGWYQDYVADKHKLQNKQVQADPRFSSYHKAGQYLRLLECFILLVEIIFKKRTTYGENGKKNYWNLLIMTEVVKGLIKLIATTKSKTNAPLFLNYSVLPPDEQAMTMNTPMASFLPALPKYSPFEKEAQSLEKFSSNFKKQAKPKVGARSGRQIPSSDQLMAVLRNGSDDVPTTSQLGEQLGLNIGEKFVLLAHQTEEMKSSLGKILMYIADTLYSIRPVVYTYLLSKYGFDSWKPFVVSLLIEMSSLYLTRKAIRIIKTDIKEKSPSFPPEVGSTIEEELSRRNHNLSHYLYRGPLFEIVMERIFKSILLPIFKRIPLIGGSFVGYIEYIIMIQQFYFFCNPSV